MRATREFVGELLGTFLLVFLGCGSVAVAVLFGSHQGLFQVAMVWGLAVALAVYATRHLSCAHLNPAVSLAMVVAGRMNPRRLPRYLLGQMAGAILGALLLYGLFSSSIAGYERLHGIVRGTPASRVTAQMFGEFYPNPGIGPDFQVSFGNALAAEAVGTFLLVLLIFSLTEGCNVGRPEDSLAPLFIGFTVTVIISVVAPLTQAGLNPARDLGPRMVAWVMGWGAAAMPDSQGGFLVVYGFGPVLGGCLAALCFVHGLEPLLDQSGSAGPCRAEVEEEGTPPGCC